MAERRRADSKWAVPLMWLGAGFLSWHSSAFLFSYILSPMLIETARAANANTESAMLIYIVSMLFANMAVIALCFMVALGLSYFTHATRQRLLLFVAGAIAVSLYAQIRGLIGYTGIYPGLPAGANMQGFVPLVLIVLLCSLAGSRIGTWIRMKKNRPGHPVETGGGHGAGWPE